MGLLQKIACTLLLLISIPALAVPTEIVVHARAKDAKFVGTSMGGALVRIRDADSGRILAEGLTRGGTGDTKKIMQQPHTRYGDITEGAAAFSATLDIDAPQFLTVEVLSPQAKKQARVLAQTQTWLVPGKPIDGAGLVVEIPGFVVDVLAPQTHSVAGGDSVAIRANVVMMCGCAVTAGGLWNGSALDVAAIVRKDGKPFKTVPLKMQAQPNTFAGALTSLAPGVYQVQVYAYDPKSKNTGLDQTTFIVK
ncbi:hypothetical protein [Microbulbifer sp. SAOS-129_SWC]|uniref:hypothetical protein n=1 Tax=Microbulbifer sp. SAOS-129_SWC TaxID=3145235 RepID=UPI0032165A16